MELWLCPVRDVVTGKDPTSRRGAERGGSGGEGIRRGGNEGRKGKGGRCITQSVGLRIGGEGL